MSLAPTACLGLRLTTLDGVGDPAWLDAFDIVQLGDEADDHPVGPTAGPTGRGQPARSGGGRNRT